MMVAQPQSHHVQAAGHEIHVTTWGEDSRPALVMWHGLARTGRDFDEAASALSDEYFVLCPDTLGRGLSAWARRPELDYSYRSFGDIALDLLEHFSVDGMRWLGTSMGGLIGVTLASDRLRGRITHLAINDIGPDIPEAATDRIASYVGSLPVFDTMTELEQWLRRNYAPFGNNTDAFWRRMTDTSCRRMDDGRLTVHYDPQIVTQFTHHRGDLDVWDAYDAITARTLLIRGESSDVLPIAVAEAMVGRGPKPRLVTMPGCGHAPTLATEHEITILRNFFSE